MRKLALVALVVGCADSSDAPSFELRVSFDRQDGSVIVNGAPVTGPLVFTAASYADAQNEIVLDVSATTATGTITTQLRPGYCRTQVSGLIQLESLAYDVVELAPPYLTLSSFVCESTAGGAAGAP